MRSLLGLSVLPLLASASPMLNVGTIHNEAAPILSSSHAKEIPDSYIVVFKKHVSPESAVVHHGWVQDVHVAKENERTELRKRSQLPFVTSLFEGLKHTYHIGDLLGYSGHFDDDVIEKVRRHPDVEYIEKDSEVHTMEDGELEKNAPWGLARISHRKGLSFGTFNKYLYTESAGEGVDAYIIDTGTNTEHVDFEGRASWGKTIPANDEDKDGNGHGTHCSGTVGGKKFGVAKKANIYAVKVLKSNGSGTMSDVVKGVEWAAVSHAKNVEAAKKGKGKKAFKGSVANMSLGGGKSAALDRAVNAAVQVGLHFAVAAGNDNADSCSYSPAAAEKAVTVGASTLADERAYFSNYGKCNDIFAPGLNIQSTWIGSKYAINTISGTSMASPHIAGLLAYFLSLQPSKDSAYAVAEITPEKLKKNLLSVATEDALADVPSNTQNILAWNGGGSSNYSQIIEEGGYTVKKHNVVSYPGFNGEETLSSNELKEDIRVVGGKVVKETSKVEERIKQISTEIEELVSEGLEDLVEELKTLPLDMA
ncbi:MAG: serine protease [Piccolia ochrophora]|nr:MAG: serine protease [Piccolia ochrophora]